MLAGDGCARFEDSGGFRGFHRSGRRRSVRARSGSPGVRASSIPAPSYAFVSMSVTPPHAASGPWCPRHSVAAALIRLSPARQRAQRPGTCKRLFDALSYGTLALPGPRPRAPARQRSVARSRRRRELAADRRRSIRPHPTTGDGPVTRACRCEPGEVSLRSTAQEAPSGQKKAVRRIRSAPGDRWRPQADSDRRPMPVAQCFLRRPRRLLGGLGRGSLQVGVPSRHRFQFQCLSRGQSSASGIFSPRHTKTG